MGKSDELKKKIMRDTIPSDIKKKELMSFLEREGFTLKRITGDHYIYSYLMKDGSKRQFVIPMASPVKRCYIKQIKDVLRENED
jgi:YcfA-like protein.